MGSNSKSTDKKDYFLEIKISKEMREGLPDSYEYVAASHQELGKQKSPCIKVEVTKEVYQAFLRPLWRDNKRVQRLVEKRKKRELAQAECRKDKSIKGVDTAVSFEGLEEVDYGFLKEQSTPTLETIAEKEELLQVLRQELAQLKDIDRTIVDMFSQGYSESKIASAVGLSQKGVNKRKHRVLAYLYERMKNYR